MVDAFRQPLTALCAGVALWALGLLLMAALGLGARFVLHADDPALAPPLPELQMAESSARLGALADYPEIGQRPLLTTDRRPTAGGERVDESAAPLDANLTGVIISGDVRIALLQDADGGRSRRAREGELLEGTAWRLQSLQPRRAVFVGPEGEKVLDLRVFDGKGGAAPTPQAAPVASGTAPPPPAPAPAHAAAPADAAAEQQAQVEEIRRRIEARRAQMRAEAANKAAIQEDTK